MADTSQSSIRYIEETTWGNTPSVGNMKEVRFTGESLGIDRSTTTSEEIRSDRQITDLIATKVEATGDINGELSYAAYDDFISAAMGNNWGAKIASDLNGVTVSNNKLVYPAGNLPAFVVGMAVRLSGFTNASNNRIVTITAVNQTTRVVTTLPALTNETPAGKIKTEGAAITNGVGNKSFTIEKHFTDVNKIIAYFGMVVDQFTVNAEAENVVTTTLSFMGKNGDTPATTYNPGNLTPAPTNEVMSAGVQDGSIIEGTTEIGLIKTLSMQIANNARSKTVIGVVGNIDIGKGRFNLTGTLNAYFEDFRVYEKYLKNQNTSLVFTLGDPNSGTYVFNMPSIKFTESSIVAGGPDEDVMVEGSYQAIRDPNTQKTLIISRI